MDPKDFAKSAAMEAAVVRKSLNNLMGIVNGIICDNHLADTEVHFLATWLEENRHIANQYPANIIFRRIHEVLADGVITDEERAELLADLKAISGNEFLETGAALPAHIAAVFDDDPYVEIENRMFVLTGKFLFGTRSACERAILKRGGMVASNVSQRTNYLVVGTLASPDWIEQNFGRKIQKAAELADSGDAEIAVVRETDWVIALK